MSLWELNAAIDGYQEAHGGGKGAKGEPLSDDEVSELGAVIDNHYGY